MHKSEKDLCTAKPASAPADSSPLLLGFDQVTEIQYSHLYLVTQGSTYITGSLHAKQKALKPNSDSTRELNSVVATSFYQFHYTMATLVLRNWERHLHIHILISIKSQKVGLWAFNFLPLDCLIPSKLFEDGLFFFKPQCLIYKMEHYGDLC